MGVAVFLQPEIHQLDSPENMASGRLGNPIKNVFIAVSVVTIIAKPSTQLLRARYKIWNGNIRVGLVFCDEFSVLVEA